MIRAVSTIFCSSGLALGIAGCNRGAESERNPATAAQDSSATKSTAPMTVRGTVVSDSGNALVVKSDTGNVTVKMVQPFHFYARVPGNLSQVKQGSFIGVTTVKQSDGSERATEIHIFPEDLRGLGEGSRMMAPATGSSSSRMTNGNVSTSRMTNGTASQSRMSNGNVSRTNGTSLVVQYAGGSQDVTVPPNTPVTELQIATRNIAVGDQVAVLVKKAADGSLTADKAISTAR